jgi:predicted acetyltransferase
MDYPIRPITADEIPAFLEADGTAFGFVPEAWGVERMNQFAELDRSLAAFDGDQIVSTGGIFSFNLTVPGGEIPMAGVTAISVRPSHRRRGILTAVMRRQLQDVRERGEPIAGLWASESIIYGRFGYGLAAETQSFSIERTRTALAHDIPSPGRTRFVSREEALAGWPAVYDRVRPSVPGFYSRSPAWWEHHRLFLRPGDTSSGAPFFVQYEEDGVVHGYVFYRVQSGEGDWLPGGSVRVRELMAATPAAYAALWRFAFGIDLVATIKGEFRPLDEPLYHMLADPRHLVRRPMDSLWLRVVDVPAALAGRRYSSEGRLVFEVRDSFCPWVQGRYELEGGPAGARCVPSRADPDIALSAASLAAIYLGGTRLQAIARAGLVEGSPAALALADAMFTWDPLPWCPEVF